MLDLYEDEERLLMHLVLSSKSSSWADPRGPAPFRTSTLAIAFALRANPEDMITAVEVLVAHDLVDTCLADVVSQGQEVAIGLRPLARLAPSLRAFAARRGASIERALPLVRAIGEDAGIVNGEGLEGGPFGTALVRSPGGAAIVALGLINETAEHVRLARPGPGEETSLRRVAEMREPAAAMLRDLAAESGDDVRKAVAAWEQFSREDALWEPRP